MQIAPVPPRAPETRSPERARRRVLFIHPSYPSQFTAIAAELNRIPGYECYALVDQRFGSNVNAAGERTLHLGFLPDGASSVTYPYLKTFEDGMRNARGIAHTLLGLRDRFHFDAIVGHAVFGGTLYLQSLLDCAVISYAELAGFQTLSARPEFPMTLDMLFSRHACEALVYTSMLHSDLCVVPSEHARRQLPSELQVKTRVQMEGFDVEEIPPGGEKERAALGLPPHVPLVGFFGRTLEAVRGFDIFVRVARRLRELVPGAQFLVIGEENTIYGNEKTFLGAASFKQYALAQAGVNPEMFHWRGVLPYPMFRRHLACLDLAVLPVFESAANWSLFEAMAAGLPVISSTRGYVPEAIEHGREGLLFDPYDVESIAQHARILLTDRALAEQLGRAARRRITECFSHARAAAGYRALIEEAIALRSSKRVM